MKYSDMYLSVKVNIFEFHFFGVQRGRIRLFKKGKEEKNQGKGREIRNSHWEIYIVYYNV